MTLPEFRPEISPEETLARQATSAALLGRLAPGMQQLLSDVAGAEMARLNRLGILTGGQTYPTVLRTQTERLLFPAFQQATEQAYGLGQRLWERQFRPWELAQRLAAEERIAAREAEIRREQIAEARRIAIEEARQRAIGGAVGALPQLLLFGRGGG